MTKGEIRERAHARGFSWWDRPAAPCLASRLPYGTPVTPERLRQVDAAELALRALGVTGNLRVRHFGDTARVEMDAAMLRRFTDPAARQSVEAAVRNAGFASVEMDPRGFRSGALNILDGGAPVSGH
jgi:pyridinium-3,5-biscarboxylic acid mononucleotide sulfurtransferase